jgi:hypothetical protein
MKYKECMAMCAMLVNGQTVIYLEEGGKWVMPCMIIPDRAKDNRPAVRFYPVQIYGTSDLMEPIEEQHILTSYPPEPNIEEGYRRFLVEFTAEIKRKMN